MSIDLSSPGRVPAGVREGGQFTTTQRTEPDVSLSVPSASADEPYSLAARHWLGTNNEERARDAIARMDGVDSVRFDDGVHALQTARGGKCFGKTGSVSYKGHSFDLEVHESVGSLSGTGYVSVRNAAGRQIATSHYSIPKTDGGRARVERDDLGATLETSVARALLLNALQEARVLDGASPQRIVEGVRTTGGKVWVILPGSSAGDSSLYFHGGRIWRGHGGSAYGSKATQQEAVVRALGGGDLARGKKVLAQLSSAMTRVQAEHDAQYPPTPEQIRRRNRA